MHYEELQNLTMLLHYAQQSFYNNHNLYIINTKTKTTFIFRNTNQRNKTCGNASRDVIIKR